VEGTSFPLFSIEKEGVFLEEKGEKISRTVEYSHTRSFAKRITIFSQKEKATIKGKRGVASPTKERGEQHVERNGMPFDNFNKSCIQSQKEKKTSQKEKGGLRRRGKRESAKRRITCGRRVQRGGSNASAIKQKKTGLPLSPARRGGKGRLKVS